MQLAPDQPSAAQILDPGWQGEPRRTCPFLFNRWHEHTLVFVWKVDVYGMDPPVLQVKREIPSRHAKVAHGGDQAPLPLVQ